MEKEAAIALGSNLGDREGNLKRALNAISNIPKLKIERISSVYETLPFETPDEQSNYYNCCAVLKTELKPEILLGACFGIEAALGRVRTYQNAARIIDLDLLFYEGESFSEKDLQLPHPRIGERAFVLAPLEELYPEDLPECFGFKMQGLKINYDEIVSKKILFF